MKSNIVVLIPAHNEESSIRYTIKAVLAQSRRADTVVVIPNGCLDNTAKLAREYAVEVLELPALAHRKSEAMNIAWETYAQEADIVVCLDADTILPPNALADWEREMLADPSIGGLSSKFTMLTAEKADEVLGHGNHPWLPASKFGNLLTRIQASEFATWTQTALDRGETSVLAGTGCAIRGKVLVEVARNSIEKAPWSYSSATEDFFLTMTIRKMGYYCAVSPTVRAYTDSMKTIKALWGQRIKWQTGTVQDLMHFGINKYSARDWAQQAMCVFNVLAKSLLIVFWTLLFATGTFTFIWFWWVLPLVFVGLDYVRSRSIPYRDKTDTIISLSFFANEVFMWLRAGWVAVSWWKVITNNKSDLWAGQYKAEKEAEYV